MTMNVDIADESYKPCRKIDINFESNVSKRHKKANRSYLPRL